ncbi:MAG: hypothetical protein ABFS45_14670 [Pseudomonadota bacterium]
MYTRHLEVPVYENRKGELEASYYNHVHVALNRLGESLRLELPGLKTLDLILQRDAWIVVDRAFNDIPVVAWTEFETEHRASLHAPISCIIRLYHANAEIILNRVIEAMEMMLGEQLEEMVGSDMAGVISYRVAYIRSHRRSKYPSRYWVVIDPFGRVLNDGDTPSHCHSDSNSAKEAACVNAQFHYGLKGTLHPSDKYEYMSLYGGEDYREWIITLPDYRQSHFTSHFTERNVLLHIRTKTRYDARGSRLLFVEEIQSDWHQQSARKRSTVSWREKIPQAPFQKEWALLAIKLVLQHAIDGGYSAIAWTPGDIQQMRYQCETSSMLRLYDRILPQYLLQLSKAWDGRIEKTLIKTKEPWISPRREGDYWVVRDKLGKFETRRRLTKPQALAISERHCKTIELVVPLFHIPGLMRRKIADDAFPLFGEMMVDKVKKALY